MTGISQKAFGIKYLGRLLSQKAEEFYTFLKPGQTSTLRPLQYVHAILHLPFKLASSLLNEF